MASISIKFFQATSWTQSLNLGSTKTTPKTTRVCPRTTRASPKITLLFQRTTLVFQKTTPAFQRITLVCPKTTQACPRSIWARTTPPWARTTRRSTQGDWWRPATTTSWGLPLSTMATTSPTQTLAFPSRLLVTTNQVQSINFSVSVVSVKIVGVNFHSHMVAINIQFFRRLSRWGWWERILRRTALLLLPPKQQHKVEKLLQCLFALHKVVPMPPCFAQRLPCWNFAQSSKASLHKSFCAEKLCTKKQNSSCMWKWKQKCCFSSGFKAFLTELGISKKEKSSPKCKA